MSESRYYIQRKSDGVVLDMAFNLQQAQANYAEADYTYIPWVVALDQHHGCPHIYQDPDNLPPEIVVTPWVEPRTLEEVLTSAYTIEADPLRAAWEGQKRDGDQAKIDAALAAWDAKRAEVKQRYTPS